MTTLRVTAAPGLTSSRFHHDGLDVVAGQWTDVDPNDPAIRSVLLEYVGTHIQVFPEQDAKLAAAGLELKAGRLVELAASPTEKAAERPEGPEKSEDAADEAKTTPSLTPTPNMRTPKKTLPHT